MSAKRSEKRNSTAGGLRGEPALSGAPEPGIRRLRFRLTLYVPLLVGAGILVTLLFSGEVRDTDVFWHLRTGQYILQNHALPLPDPFAFPNTGSAYPGEEITRRFNLTHEWLSQAIMFLIYAGAGFPGLVVARILLLFAFCGLAGWIAFYRTRDFTLSLAAALGAAAMAFYFEQSRPFLATFVFLGLTMAILETRRGLWFLPPIFLIWANCHSGFILGWVLCAAYSFEALVLRQRTNPPLWLVSLTAILASTLNPNGIRILQVLWLYRHSAIQTNNLEWQRPIFWTPSIYSFLLFGSLVALIAARRNARLADWFLYIVFAAISLLAVRNTIFIGLIGPVLIASYLPKWRWLPPAALTLAVAGLISFDIAPAFAAQNVLTFRAAEWQLPSGAAGFIANRHIGARMFNTYEEGGYLIWRLWPQQRVFIDSRGLSEKVFTDYRRVLYDTSGGKTALDILDRYGIDLVAIDGFDYLSGQVYPVAINLASAPSAGWALAYADDKSLVFVRHPPPDMARLDPRAALFQSLDSQCAEHLRHDPIHPRCAFGLGELYAFRGDPAHAREWMSTYIAHRTGPDREAGQIYDSLTVTVLTQQASASQAKGDLRRAEGLLRQALATAERSLGPDHPDTAGALNNLAAVLETESDYPEAESLFRRSLEICEKKFGPSDPHTAIALDNLAGALEARGDLTGAEALLRRAVSIAGNSLAPNDPAVQTIREDYEDLRKAVAAHNKQLQ